MGVRRGASALPTLLLTADPWTFNCNTQDRSRIQSGRHGRGRGEAPWRTMVGRHSIALCEQAKRVPASAYTHMQTRTRKMAGARALTVQQDGDGKQLIASRTCSVVPRVRLVHSQANAPALHHQRYIMNLRRTYASKKMNISYG